MSISPTVDENYRLRAADLEGLARQVEIANITYQGVEEMAPVMHFVGQSKRMVMSPEQVNEMLEITGTVLAPKWVGTRILLQPHESGGEFYIRIEPLTAKQRGRPMPTYVSEDRRGWILALSVVIIILVASLIIASLDLSPLFAALEQVRATVDEMRDTWLRR